MKKISATLFSQQIVKKRLLQNLPVYNFGLGANPLPAPALYTHYLSNSLDCKLYTSATGISRLQQALKTHNPSIENFIVGNGLKELLFIVQMAFEGTIYHITPSWVSYKEQINLLNKQNNLIEIPTYIENNFDLDFNLIEEKLKQGQTDKLLILNNPNNPTGKHYNKEDVIQLANLCKRYNVLVLADEIYAKLAYYKPFYSISEEYPENTLIASSISKDMACGGHRLGWIGFPKKQEELFSIIQAYSSTIYSCASHPFQTAYADYLLQADDYLIYNNNTHSIYKTIIDKSYEILSKTKLRIVKPGGAWYIFVDFENYKDKLNINNSAELQNYLLEKFGIVSIAGNEFGYDGVAVRLSLIDIDVRYLNMNVILTEKEILDASRKIFEGLELLVDSLI